MLGASDITTTATSVDDERLLRLLLTELPAAKAAALAAKITGGDKKQFYQMALAQKG